MVPRHRALSTITEVEVQSANGEVVPASVITALLAGAGFSIACLIALQGKTPAAEIRRGAIAVAAGIILALAFGDLFPESLEFDHSGAIIGFAAGFALLYLLEVLSLAHTHHAPDEPGAASHRHSLTAFIVGLAFHNIADGFVVGVSGHATTGTTIATGIGVMIHQLPVGVSVAAVLLSAAAPRRQVLGVALGLGILIPVTALIAAAVPLPDDRVHGVLLGAASGILTYLGAAHLLPEARSEHPSRASGALFAGTFIVMIIGTLTLLAD